MKPSNHAIKGLDRVLGLDVARASVVLFASFSRRTRTVANTPEALREALAPFADYQLMVCEVTGGYERAALEAAFSLGLPAHRADALRVKRYIGSLGGRAKTDPIDASWLARYGQERGQTLLRWQPREADRDALASQVRHRRYLVAARSEAKNRRRPPTLSPSRPSSKRKSTFSATRSRASTRPSPPCWPIPPIWGPPSDNSAPSSASDPSSPETCWPSCQSSAHSIDVRPHASLALRHTQGTQASSQDAGAPATDETGCAPSCLWPRSPQPAQTRPCAPSPSA